MLPLLTRQRIAERRTAYTESPSDLCLRNSRNAQPSCEQNLFGCEFTKGSIFTARFLEMVSALYRRIALIVTVGPKEQMVWSYTGPIVAMMEHPKVMRNLSDMDFPRYAMGKSIAARVAVLDGSVTNTLCASPKPAGTCFLDVLPKAFNDWLRRDRHFVIIAEGAF